MVKIHSAPRQVPTIRILRKLLPPKNCPYLEDEEGHLSYMGQMLVQLHVGTKLFVKKKPIRLVSELNQLYPHFTRMCRGKIVQTDLCTTITDLRPSPENEKRLAELLAGICTVQFSNRGE